MGWLIATKQFKWREPRAFAVRIRQVEAVGRRRMKIRASLMLAVVLPILYGLVVVLNQRLHDAPWWFLLPVLTMIGMAVPWFDGVYFWSSSSIIVFDQRVVRLDGNGNEQVEMKDLRDFGMVDAGDYRILVLGTTKGGQMAVGVPLDADLDAVGEYLAGRGLARLSAARTWARLPGWHDAP